MKLEKICILGGTGFVGEPLATRLANSGYQIKILTRHRERHRQFTVLPTVELVEADIHENKVLETQFSGCDAVINLVGILNGSEQDFRGAHAALPRRVVNACAEAGVSRLLHMSALNADAKNGASLYLRTKGEGEANALKGAKRGIAVTCFQPSVIFGPGDGLFNRFATLLNLSLVLPLACPNARFAPVYVMDVVQAFCTALTDESTFGSTLELCGPHTYTLKELVEYTAKLMGRRRWVWELPDNLARLQARTFDRLHIPLFSMDNYQSLQVDSVCRCNGLASLGIEPRSVESVMPKHFNSPSQRAQYYSFRRVARRD